ncbi:DNA double-strand break repair nuclease NurA [Candidatus Bathyarchaeota archaeon]|nr:DNA double-strand break repair nuclease NurA [Candidatus Bathyarchaeota archaeon]
MSYIRLNIEDLDDVKEKIKETFLQQNKSIVEIRDSVNIHYAKPRKTRKVFAVDSGFNSAYETNFVLFKAAVVNEEMEVDRSEDIYMFYVANYQIDRLKRLLMQQSLYEALKKTVQSGKADGSMVLVDGTITLGIFSSTLNDRGEYRRHFTDFYDKLYCPLMEECLKRDIIILGFLKRTGCSYLAKHLKLSGTYDLTIINYLLREGGQHIGPIPILDTNADRAKIHHKYVTFYLNLKSWNYRFELLKEQENTSQECVENLLHLATEAHYGMNPIFSKADEYARVTKREADLKFNYVAHDLDDESRTRLRLDARKKTHFGYSAGRFSGRLLE